VSGATSASDGIVTSPAPDRTPQRGDRRTPFGGANPFLAVVGAVLIIAALVGYFREQPAEMVDLFAFLGVVVCALAVFEPLVEGQLSLSPTNLTVELRRREQIAEAVEATEDELTAKQPLPELPSPGRPFILLSQRARRRLDELAPDARERVSQELRSKLEGMEFDGDATNGAKPQPEYKAVALDDDFEVVFRPLTEDEMRAVGRPEFGRGYVVADVIPRKQVLVQM
jgi:hypothetical protein